MAVIARGLHLGADTNWNIPSYNGNTGGAMQVLVDRLPMENVGDRGGDTDIFIIQASSCLLDCWR